MATLGETIQDQHITNIPGDKNQRGINVYSISQLYGMSGRNKEGEVQRGTTEIPRFVLNPYDRNEIFARSSILQGVTTGRAKRIAGLKWKVTKNNKRLDIALENLREWHEYYLELPTTDIKHAVAKHRIGQKIRTILPDVLEDMSNFQKSLHRFKKRVRRESENSATEIETWLEHPNGEDSFFQFIHKIVIDLMIHGSCGVYKESAGGEVKNVYTLPGGTILPWKSMYVGGPRAYFQVIPGHDPKIYFTDEVAYMRYVPVSWSTYGEVPLEALINKIAETLLFDRRSAEQADGTKPPEKLVVFGKNAPGSIGDLDGIEASLPLPKDEQQRIETKMNEAKKEAIATLSGYGTPIVLDLSKADTFGHQQTRQDKIIRDIAFVYNMSNAEVNLTGGEFTSGKETAGVQEEIEQQKGVGPMLLMIQELLNREIIPYKYGFGYEFSFDISPSESEEVDLMQKKVNTGTWSVNEIREERGDDPYPDAEYDRPQQAAAGQPDGTEVAPFNMRSL